MNILVVDDDVVSRVVLTEQLQNFGHVVSSAIDGEDAWKVYQEKKPQLVITDWMMPKVDGLELSRMIRAENREFYTYIVFLTILHGKGSFLEAMNAGADDVITKPFDSEQLSARLRVADRILGLQHEIRQLHGLLPICSYCRRIREDNDTWITIEQYITQRTETAFSHGICPDCYEKKVKPEIALHRAKDTDL